MANGEAPHCEVVGREAASRFARHLARLAERAPLSADGVANALAAWLDGPQPALDQVYHIARERCESLWDEADLPRRRSHVYERAVVARFEHLLRSSNGSVPPVSRRMVLGLTFALTKLIGSDLFSSSANQARGIAGELGDPEGDKIPPEAFADPRMRRLIHNSLMELARQFVDFPRQLGEFVRLINGRLAAPQPDGWDRHWSLTRHTALLVLQALYADLRDELERYGGAEAQIHYGPDAAEVLDAFLAALDQAMRLAGRPWLLKAIGS